MLLRINEADVSDVEIVFSLVPPKETSFDYVSDVINGIDPETVRPIPNLQVMENLRFSECLSDSLAVEVFTSRFDDRAGVAQAVQEQRRVVV